MIDGSRHGSDECFKFSFCGGGGKGVEKNVAAWTHLREWSGRLVTRRTNQHDAQSFSKTKSSS